jgi:hypothetical protein
MLIARLKFYTLKQTTRNYIWILLISVRCIIWWHIIYTRIRAKYYSPQWYSTIYLLHIIISVSYHIYVHITLLWNSIKQFIRISVWCMSIVCINTWNNNNNKVLTVDLTTLNHWYISSRLIFKKDLYIILKTPRKNLYTVRIIVTMLFAKYNDFVSVIFKS